MGYINYSMSERAAEAYENGQQPMSRWTKEEILDTIYESLEDKEKFKYFETLTTKQLKEEFLFLRSWHHTSSKFNKTYFYAVATEYANSVSIEYLIALKETKIEKKEKAPNMYITALVEYKYWTGTRKHPKCEIRKEVVNFRSEDKMVETKTGNKRLTSLTIIKQVEQKTKYADAKKVSK